jgi:hypothetical protein
MFKKMLQVSSALGRGPVSEVEPNVAPSGLSTWGRSGLGITPISWLWKATR